MGKASETGGVKPMRIESRLINERERLVGMTDAERSWRKQWLNDQILSPNEPRNVPQMYKATYNPIRRVYRWPLDQLGKALVPVLGTNKANFVRYTTGKIGLGIAIVYYFYYHTKYHERDWTGRHGWKIFRSREGIVEGDPGYPCPSEKSKGSDYYTAGFDKVHLNL